MIKMTTQNGVGNFSVDLDLIDEFLEQERSDCALRELPGPPPPPESTEITQLGSDTQRHNPPFLVSRCTDPQVHRPFSQLGQRTMALHVSNQGGVSRCHRSQGSAPGRAGGVLRAQGSTDHLEKFLDTPKCVIVEQPKERGMRFRYECEGRSAGSILGASSTEASKTLPAIEIQGNFKQTKKAKVTVSLVTKDIPYRPHPHSLVGKDCADGICVVHLTLRTNQKHSFANLGIQCVRRKELDAALEKRRRQKIDPFNTDHSKSIEDIDMNVVRLCFQCELEKEDGEKILLSPVVSNPIFDKKATTTSELKINRLNVVRGPCTGKTEIYLLCDKVQKDDIEIIFSRDQWEAKAEFAQTDVHRQIAIVFKSPPYQEQHITEEVDVSVFLRRLSDHMDSEPVKFTYLPHNPDPYEVNRKRKLKPDMKETCSVAAQQLTMPETPSTYQLDQFSCVSSETTYATADLQEPHSSQLSRDLEEIHYPAVMDFKQENNGSNLEMTSEDLQLILRALSQSLDSSHGLPSALLPTGLEEQQQSYAFRELGQLADPMSSDPDIMSSMNLLNMDQNIALPIDNQPLMDIFYNDVQLNNGAHTVPIDTLSLEPAGPNSQGRHSFDNACNNAGNTDTCTDL